jgi:PAS domain S-box-containing protein
MLHVPRLRALAVVVLAMAMGIVAAPAAGQPAKAMLVIHTYGHNAPGRFAFDAAFARFVREAADPKVDLYVETLDVNRFADEAQTERTRAYLRARYVDKKLAVVVAAYDRALSFLLGGGEPLFPGVPVAALLARYPASLPEHVVATWSGLAFGESAALALKLKPQSQQIALIDGAVGAGADAVHEEARMQVTHAVPQIPVVSLRNLPLDELLSRVRALPAETIIIVVRQVIGPRGEPIATADAVREIARVAPAPVYALTDQLIGSGAVGGVAVSLESEAANLAGLALRCAREGVVRIPPIKGVPVAVFDGRQLQRWGIDEALLPAGSVVRFQQLSVWRQYRPYLLGAILIVALQTALIAGLVIQRVRRRRMEQALRESEERFRLMANGAPVMVWTARPDMATDFFNSTVLAFSGLPIEQLLGDGWLQRMHPDDVERCVNNYVPAFAARRPFQMEYRFRRADETYRWVLDTGVPRYGPDGSFAGYIGSALDITDRREMEHSLLANQTALQQSYEQNQDLAGRLIHAQEEERARIARDLHDDVSQQIAGVGILLSGLKRSMRPSGPRPEIDEALAGLQERTARLADSIRHLSHELHPGMLKHTGLIAALQQHCAEVERHHGLTVTLSARDDFDWLEFDAALCLYRVTQEALTNIVRHARARTTRVELTRAASAIELRVTDDGVGFIAAERTRSGLGLRSIDERVRLAQGSVSVESTPGHGTQVVVQIPAPLARQVPLQ